MSAESPTLLSPSQRRIAAFALTLLALLGSVALLIGAIMALGQLVSFFSNVLWPLALAGVLALILRPAVELFQRRLRLRRLSAVVLLYGLAALLVGGALIFVLPPVIEQAVNFLANLGEYWTRASAYVQAHYPQWMEFSRRQLANPTIRKLADTVSTEAHGMVSLALPSLRAAGGGVLGGFAFVTHLAIVPVYLFFFLLAHGEPTEKLPGHLTFLQPDLRQDLAFLLREFVAIVESFFRGQLLIGLLMGVLLALGFTLVGLRFGLFLGLAFGLLNIVPYLGSILGLAIALPLAFFQPGGGWQLVGLVLLVKLIVQTIESWVLTPKIMGDRTGLHPVAIIVAIFFWGTAFGGVLGMLFAIPLTAFFVTAWRLAKQKYFDAPHA
ncbi:MAG: AI-2E family transporter [Opitutus sp.]|nr:AI-2E family transporter [Opitutus sp.]